MMSERPGEELPLKIHDIPFLSMRTTRSAALVGLATLLCGSVGLADSPIAPRSYGTYREGAMTVPLHRGAAVPYELTVIALPNDCERSVEAKIVWSEEDNFVKVRLRGRGVLEPRPVITRTLGVDYFPNQFWPEPKDVIGGRYQLWFISSGEALDFYYDPETLLLLGSEYDFETPPADAIVLQFPTVKVFPTPFFQPDERGDLDVRFEFPYDHIVRGDRPEFAHHYATFIPHDLCQANPFRYDQSTTRPYITKPLPASEARTFGDWLRNGLILDTTVEAPEYYTEPPLTTMLATYSNALVVGGGVPRGWTWDLEAALQNIAPPIRPWEGAGSCTNWFKPIHTQNLYFCPPAP
jgi:hypothetical protein